MPAAATKAEVDTMLQEASAVWRVVYNFANSASPNLRDKIDALFDDLAGEYSGNVFGPAQNLHGDIGTMLGRARNTISGIARAYGRAFGLTGGGLAELWPQIYQKFDDESWSVDSRELSFGDIAARAQATGSLQAVAKADLSGGNDYFRLTYADGTTHAFWFNVSGGDSAPGGASAADNTSEVDVSGDTTAADVAATIESVVNADATGVTADDSAGSGQVDFTVTAYGFDGNDWEISENVANAGFTVTAFSGGQDGTAVSGDGEILRLQTDLFGNDIEACTAEIKHFEVITDADSGAEAGEESIQVRGEEAEPYASLQAGSGLVANIGGRSARHTRSYLNNPSFDDDAVSSSPTSLTGWDVDGDIANYEIEATAFRTMPGVSAANSRGLNQTAADKITQRFKVALDPTRPYMLAVAVKGFNSADGNAIIRCGSNSKTVAVTSSWQQVHLDLDENLWYDNFREATLDVEIEWTGTTGNVVWDDVVFSPFELVDGTWYLALGGATHWSRREILSCQDTEGNSSAIIQWFLRQAGLYLPGNKAGSETLADPTL